MDRSSRSTPTGPGSRGGRWHEPEWRREYHRRWRLTHPEYREREAFRRFRERAIKRGEDPGMSTRLTFGRLPILAAPCSCESCRCTNEVPIVACGMCLSGLHEETP